MLWKTWFGRCRYRSRAIVVKDNGLFRWLTFGGTDLQTLLYKPHPQKNGLAYIKPLILAPRQFPARTCLLGLGGGGVAHALSSVIKPETITVIELSQEVIDIAHQFFKIDALTGLNIIKADAMQYVTSTASHTFGHVLVDLYEKDHFPSSCFSDYFFESCQRLLTPQGFLSINIPTKKEYDTIAPWISKLFNKQVVTIPIKKYHHYILIGSHQPIKNILLTLHDEKKLKTIEWLPETGYWGIP